MADDYCDSVVCPMFAGNCPEDDDYHVQKAGSCCSYCAGTVCEDTENTRCDSDDTPVCSPGYYRGEGCADVVPESDRIEIHIEITVNGIILTEEDIKFFIAKKLGIDAMYITVDKTGDSTFVIAISWEKTSPEDLDESAANSTKLLLPILTSLRPAPPRPMHLRLLPAFVVALAFYNNPKDLFF